MGFEGECLNFWSLHSFHNDFVCGHLRVGRGSNVDGQEQYVSGQGLYCGMAGAVMLEIAFPVNFASPKF